MNLQNEMFFDHHTHLLDPGLTTLSKRQFVFRFLHGYMDMEPLDQKGLDADYAWGRASERQYNNTANLGLIKVMVNYMAMRFQCDATIEAVLECRNKLICGDSERLKEYIRSLYEEEHIIGTVLDSSDPWKDSKYKVFPVPVFRLYNFENDYFELLPAANSFDELIEEIKRRTRQAISQGFTALKGHLAENYTMYCKTVSDKQANSELTAAQRGVHESLEKVFFAMMRHIMYLAQELDIVLHIHAGTTGFNRPSANFVPNLDPFLFVPFLMSDKNFIKTKIAFLHQGYPYTRHAGMMAYSFPNIYVDTSWVLPWNALAFRTSLEDMLGICPHTKILLGTGQHGLPETAWISAKIAKATLADIMKDHVRMGLLTEKQALATSRQLLSENALALYNIA